MSVNRKYSKEVLSLAVIVAIFGAAFFERPVYAFQVEVTLATDVDPDPDVFETTITADEVVIDLDGPGGLPPASMLGFNSLVPGPEIRVKAGDRVKVHVINNMDVDPGDPEANHLTIHWHGIELNNPSDGTPISQNLIAPGGGTYEYDFIAPRAGVFWYHPHHAPTDPTFKGLYGSFIVTSAAEATLTANNILPSLDKTIILSDTTLCAQVDATDLPRVQDACMGQPGGLIPDIQPPHNCPGMPGNCQVFEGKLVLSNGRAVTPTDTIEVPEGSGLRLRFINTASTRYFRLVPPSGAGNSLFRIGGEGGLLDNVRLEGGMLGLLTTGFNSGEILLPPGSRADVVIDPQGNEGDMLSILSDLAPPMNYNRGMATNPNLVTGPVVQIVIGPPGTAYSIANGDPVLTHPSVGTPIEDLGAIPAGQLATLTDPSMLMPPTPGSTNHAIEFRTGAMMPTIDGVVGMFDEHMGGDFEDVPHIDSSRYARIGDLLELSIENMIGQDHPFHLHGFSIQPLSLTDGVNTFNYDYREFIDNINIKVDHKLTFRVRLDDRPSYPFDPATCGAEGRWVFHCHIFHHAGLGMISELVVLPACTAPEIICPEEVVVRCDSPEGAFVGNVDLGVTVVDMCSQEVTLTDNRPVDFYPPSCPGDRPTIVTVTATSDCGLEDTCDVKVYTYGPMCCPGFADAELTLLPADLDLRQETDGPTETKANFDIWNENERRFSGSHRCVSCWDQTLLSLFGSPNHFLRAVIGTDKGRAKVDGLSSQVCPGSVEAPMLGVVVKEVTFLGRITDVLRSAITPVGTGTESATIQYDIIGGPQSARQGTKGRRDEGTEGMANEELSLTPFEMGNRPSAIDNSGAVAGINPGGRADIAHKGSLLFWPRVEVRWDAAGQIVSDTFLTLANDEAGDVSVQLYLVNGDAPLAGTCLPICVLQFGPACADVPGCVEEREHPGWNKSDVQIPLTANQPLYWSSWTGQPAGVSSFAVLDPGPPPGRPDDDPRNPGGRILRGFVVGWAVNANGKEICWNHLTGNALVIHYPDAGAFEYNAWAFQCVSGVPQGAETDAFPGVLQMDGQEYEFAPDALTFDFYTVGSTVLSHPELRRAVR